MPDLTRITHDAGICQGKPCIRHMRWPVEVILDLVASGVTMEAIMADHPEVEREDILAALHYARLRVSGEPRRGEHPRDAARRAWVERQESFRDLTEDYERRMEAANPQDRRLLSAEFARERSEHRTQDVASDKRPAGVAVMMQQIMWTRWLEVAVEHERAARAAFDLVMVTKGCHALQDELHASLVAISAAAFAVEGLYEDVRYRVPFDGGDNEAVRLRRVFQAAFTLAGPEADRLNTDLRWLFDLRDQAVHPYTEAEEPQPHLAGFLTGAELSRWGARNATRAVDLTLGLLAKAQSLPTKAPAWVRRWAVDRGPYLDRAVQMARQRRIAGV